MERRFGGDSELVPCRSDRLAQAAGDEKTYQCEGVTSMIGVYIVTKNMTVEQHTEGRARLRAAGAPEGAMKLHSVFGEDGQLQVFDLWESQEAFDEFLTYLGPVMQDLAIELAQPPTIMPIVALEQQ
jgi:hypothetical protein